jgi:hypothetical protein
MLKVKKIVTIVITLSVLSGCASKGFNREALQSQLGVTKPVYDDKEIKEAYTKKPNLPRPFKLAIYFKAPKHSGRFPDWRWSESDKSSLDEIAADLKSRGVISEAFPIISSIVTDEDVRSLRLVAAKHGADALLIIGGAAQVDKYLNNWGWTYALILPTLFVPGSEAETLFVTSATMWDVKNDYLYLTSESEATAKETYVAAFGKRDIDLIDEAKGRALQKLKEQIKSSISGQKL